MPSGRTRHPDAAVAAQVIEKAAAGCTRDQISAAVGVPVRTLTRWYGEAMKTGRATAIATIGGVLYEKARKGDTASVIFYLKTRGDPGQWRETSRIETTGADGAPLHPGGVILVPVLSADTWAEEVARRQAALIAQERAMLARRIADAV